MNRYVPEQPPNSEDGLALDESERIRLVEREHRPAGIERPHEWGHAMFHAVVENPLALVDPVATPRALQRRRQEGLTRHEALHAIGAVLALALHIGHARTTRRRGGRRPGPVRGRPGGAECGFVAADVCRG